VIAMIIKVKIRNIIKMNRRRINFSSGLAG
jgi:hypothetical protein